LSRIATCRIFAAKCGVKPDIIKKQSDEEHSAFEKEMDSLNCAHEEKMYKMNKVIEGQLHSISKQNEFEAAMDLAEVRYQYSGEKKHYRDFYRYRDSLNKWILYKDSIEKSIEIYIKK